MLKTLIIFTFLSNYAFGSIITDFPQNESIHLSNGEVIALPLHVYQASGMLLIGLVDFEEVKNITEKSGLYPLEIIPGKSLGMVYALDYQKASIPSYKEVIVSLVVGEGQSQSKFSDLASFLMAYSPFMKNLLQGKLPNTGTYIHRISVTSETSKLLGIEAWGTPKVIEHFMYKSSDKKTVLVSKEASFAVNKRLSIPLPLNLYTTSFTSYEIKQTRFESRLKGQGRMGLFTPQDKLVQGKELKRLGFHPLSWQEFLNVEAVFFSGDMPK